MSRQFQIPLIGAGVLLLAATASAQWTSIHRDGTNNAVVAIEATLTDVSAGPAQSSADEGLAGSVRPIVHDGVVYTVFMDDGGTPFDPSDDTVRLKAFSRGDLSLLWTSPDLDTGNTVAFESASAPTWHDGGDGAVLFYPSGSTLQALHADTGAIKWSTLFDDTNTSTTNAAHGLVNTSPVVGGGNVFVQTYYDSFSAPSELSQVVAVDADTGAVSWFEVTGGRGQAGPVYYGEGTGDPAVIVNVPGGLVALRADDGGTVWRHDGAVPGGPWSVSDEIWVEPVIADGSLFAMTYNFSGTGGNIVRVDPATGELLWKVDAPATLAGDIPFVYTGSPARLHTAGGPFGDASLVAYDPADGSEAFRTPLAVGTFRNYMAATNDRLYLAASGLRVFDLGGTQTSIHATGAIDAPVTLDSNGDLLLVAGGRLHVFSQASNVEGWMHFR